MFANRKLATSIMVVDDHALVRRTLCARLVRENSFRVVAAVGTVAEALANARALRPDVILMDIELEDGDGLAAVREFVQTLPTRVIIVSGFGHDSYIDAALEAGACGYVTKSAALSVLIEAIHAVSSGATFFSPDVEERLASKPSARRPSLRLPPSPQSTSRKTPLAQLTDRQREVLIGIAQGRSKREIAAILCLSVKTIDTHCANMMERLRLNDRVELARYAIREGLIEP